MYQSTLEIILLQEKKIKKYAIIHKSKKYIIIFVTTYCVKKKMYSKIQLCLKIRGFYVIRITLYMGDWNAADKQKPNVCGTRQISPISYFLLRPCFHLVSKLQTHKTYVLLICIPFAFRLFLSHYLFIFKSGTSESEVDKIFDK